MQVGNNVNFCLFPQARAAWTLIISRKSPLRTDRKRYPEICCSLPSEESSAVRASAVSLNTVAF
jgi:hypothetical protein